MVNNHKQGHLREEAMVNSRKAEANSKDRQDCKVTAANKFNGYKEATVRVDSKSKDHSELPENKALRKPVNLEYKEALLIAQRWHVCAKTLNLEIVCATA